MKHFFPAIRRALTATLLLVLPGSLAGAPLESPPDLRTVPPDLEPPPLTEGRPAPGRRVRLTLPEYAGTEVYHTLYLPRDWRPGRRFPVLVEYAGNGPYRSPYGDVSPGTVEGSALSYGISGGDGFLWLGLPYVDSTGTRNQTQWWGDVPATLRYALRAVRTVCEEFGGDSGAVVLTGFSRGAIGCGYLGLHDDEIADTWLAFIPYSHYDGVRRWEYPGSEPAAAIRRLGRLRGRASFVTHEADVEATRRFVHATGVEAPFVFRPVPFRNHSDGWALRDTPLRRELRSWLAWVLRERPGTRTLPGRVLGASGEPLAGVRVRSGRTHWSDTGADGRFELRGLVEGERPLRAEESAAGRLLAEGTVELAGSDARGVELRVTRSVAPPSRRGFAPPRAARRGPAPGSHARFAPRARAPGSPP